MRAYTVLLPPGAARGSVPATAPPAEAARLIPEGFSWLAFLFGPLWLAAHRCWAAALGAFLLTLFALVLPAPLDGPALLGLHLLLGLHSHDLRRWTLTRRGWRLAHVVLASGEEAALARALAAEPRLAPLFAGPRA
ncbi:DUF2628 domain-containing protein [Rubritepida flocculans]|uniref:DUF2628 domain-containing protein n=1 Tax=Rubritepida flocculans TaxID=182403 RepID=UPI000684A28C|nr:DUF2628 domain-containing protein [Rubritepida flocculans]